MLRQIAEESQRFLTAEMVGNYAGFIRLIDGYEIRLVAVNRFSHYIAPPIQVPLRINRGTQAVYCG